METYERIFADYEAAKQAQKITGGKLDTMYVCDENGNPRTDAGEPIFVYRVTYKQLF